MRPTPSETTHGAGRSRPTGGYLFLAVLVGGAVVGGGHLTITQGMMAGLVAVVVFVALVRSKPGTPGSRGPILLSVPGTPGSVPETPASVPDPLSVGAFAAPDWAEKLFLAALLWAAVVAILSVLPIPAFLLDFVSPFTAGPWRMGEGDGFRAASVAPEASFEWMVLGGTACLGYLWGRLYLASNTSWFARRFFYAAAAVAAVALILYATGNEPVRGLSATTTARLRGFYSNPNRFAVWLSMALIVGSAWYLDRKHPIRTGNARLRENVLAAAGLGVLFAAITLTASRGTFIALVAVAAMTLWAMLGTPGSRGLDSLSVPGGRFAVRAGRAVSGRVLLFMGAVPVAGLVAAAYLYPRLTVLPEEISRVEVWRTTARAAWDFPAFGSGLGTFGEVFRRYQPQHVSGFYRHAHNDYAELFLELGPAGFLLGFAFLIFVVKGWRKVLRRRGSGHSPYTMAGLSAVTVAAVTSFYDFPLRQPANLLLFSVLLGMTSGRLAAYRRHRPRTTRPDSHPIAVPETPGSVWKWAAAALFLAALLVTAAASLRFAASRLEPERVPGLLALADRLEPGAGDNLRDASGNSYTRFWREPSNENLEAAVSTTARAAECLLYDPFLAYRAGVMAAVVGDTLVGDQLVARSVEMAPAYSGLKRNAATYFFRRYLYDRRRSSVFAIWMGRVLSGEPREQLRWAGHLLDAGVPDKVARLVVGPEALPGYIEHLFKRGMWRAVVELSGGKSVLPRSVLPLRSGALVAVGREQEGIELVKRLLVPVDDHVEKRLKMAAQALPDPKGKFLVTVVEKLRESSGNMRWIIKEADRRRLDTLTMVWAARYVRFRGDPWGYQMLTRALRRLGRGADVARIIHDALERFPADVQLWTEAIALEESGMVKTGFVEYFSDSHKPPSAVLDTIAGMLIKNGRPAKAVALVEDALVGLGTPGPSRPRTLGSVPDSRSLPQAREMVENARLRKVERHLKVLLRAYRELGLQDAGDALERLIAVLAARGRAGGMERPDRERLRKPDSFPAPSVERGK